MQQPVYLSKHEALEEVFNIELSNIRWPSRKVSKEALLEVLARESYNLAKDLGLCAKSLSVLLTKLWPDKPKNNSKVCYYLLGKYGLKHCPSCTHIYSLDMFHKNVFKADGYGGYCTTCFNSNVKDMRREYVAGRRASKLDRTPPWADLQKIKDIYAMCPTGYHVDHIIPLQGVYVSGFHVESNLQYLLAKYNIEKSNKFIPG